VNFFMNKFRKLGFIEYNGGLKVNMALLSVVLTTAVLDPHRSSDSAARTSSWQSWLVDNCRVSISRHRLPVPGSVISLLS
jgi:hypothetical protein